MKVIGLKNLIILFRRVTGVLPAIVNKNLYDVLNEDLNSGFDNRHEIKFKKLFNYYKRSVIKYIKKI